MDMKIVGITVAILVSITVLAGVLMPVLDDATATTDTFTNEGVFNYGIFKPTDTYTFTYDNSTGAMTVNGESVTVPGVTLTNYNSYSVLASDDWLFRFGSNANGYYMQMIGKDKVGSTLLTGGTCSASITNGDLVLTLTDSENNTTTKTLGFTEFYSIVPNEDVAVMKISNQAVYIKGDSPLYGSGLTTVSAWNNAFHFEGTYDDGITISSPNLSTATFDNITWNIEPVDGYIDLYKLTSIEFDITNSGTTVHATYSYFGVPSEVTAERSVHFTDNQNALLAVIPMLVIVAILIGVVALVIRSRLD